MKVLSLLHNRSETKNRDSREMTAKKVIKMAQKLSGNYRHRMPVLCSDMCGHHALFLVMYGCGFNDSGDSGS